MMLLRILILLILPAVLRAALSANTIWEVRTTGSDNNGGGFVSGGSGTDFSQQNAAQFSGTDLASTNGTTNPCVVSSAAHNFVNSDVDNTIQITAGTNWTLGFYRIVSAAAQKATLDRACGSVASLSAGTWAEGGALASPGKASGAKAAGNDVYIKAGTYTLSTATVNVAGGPIDDTVGGVDQTNATYWTGYNTTRTLLNTDTTRPTILVPATGVTTITIFKLSASHTSVRNIIVDGAAKVSITGWDFAVNYQRGARIKSQNTTVRGIYIEGGNSQVVSRGEATGASGTDGIDITSPGLCVDCESYGNTTLGYMMGVNAVCIRCISSGNTGASVDGFSLNSVGYRCVNCVSYGNGRHGFDLSGNSGFGSHLENAIAEGNGGWGYNSDGVKEGVFLINCAAYNNTSGSYNSTNITNVESFVTGTASFFTNAASGDFSLNNTAGGGAAARAAGFPGLMPRGLTTGYLDIGVAQHADPVCAGGGGGGGIMRRCR